MVPAPSSNAPASSGGLAAKMRNALQSLSPFKAGKQRPPPV